MNESYEDYVAQYGSMLKAFSAYVFGEMPPDEAKVFHDRFETAERSRRGAILGLQARHGSVRNALQLYHAGVLDAESERVLELYVLTCGCSHIGGAR